MKRKNVLLLLLVFLLLLTPSCVLIVQAIGTSPFPERETLEEVEMRFEASDGKKADSSIPIARSADSPEVGLLYAIFASAKRVSRRSLPGKNASYVLTFRGERPDETMKLYIAASDFSIYLLTSGKRLYRLAMPTVSYRTVVLTPSAASFSYNGVEVASPYDYPESDSTDGKGVAAIRVTSWAVVTGFLFSGENAEVRYSLYNKNGDLLLETTDENEVVRLAPDRALMDVTTALSDEISVTLRYYLIVRE